MKTYKAGRGRGAKRCGGERYAPVLHREGLGTGTHVTPLAGRLTVQLHSNRQKEQDQTTHWHASHDRGCSMTKGGASTYSSDMMLDSRH